MEDIKELLQTIVEQLDSQAERDLVARLSQESKDVTLNEIHSSIDGVRDAVLEVEYKLDQIEMRLETIEKNQKMKK
ncbi:hypothetical protein RZE82_03190 [Mollicutes bacterium LVI A0039]|nr:hypothetical protein RZE82_03190 [Mollicutes bacterium LVI A0039]